MFDVVAIDAAQAGGRQDDAVGCCRRCQSRGGHDRSFVLSSVGEAVDVRVDRGRRETGPTGWRSTSVMRRPVPQSR